MKCETCGELMKRQHEFVESYVCDCCGEKIIVKEQSPKEKARKFMAALWDRGEDVAEWDFVEDAYIAGYEQAIKDFKYKISNL